MLPAQHKLHWPALGFLCLAMLSMLAVPGPAAVGQEIPRVLPAGRIPLDARLKPARKYADVYHPWQPPATKEAWEEEKARLREQILVGIGLWPMPQPAPLQPVIHGKIEREDYTVEKVYFQSLPGHYVTGNLYRPKNGGDKKPGVLCPHGHWANGRFYDAGDDPAKKQIEKQAEKFNSGAHFPLQARMVGLARMGCVVFHYDMVGYADNQPIGHRTEFKDVNAVLQLHELMGLQTFNSIRALDFISSLPDVDASRIGVTGASGGGTQTFILAAIDPRPTVVFPAVMVSTNMQGGCQCENSAYLRIGTNNIAFAAMFAPKPQAMSGANDWTLNIETKGLPELKKIYGLYGAADLVQAKCYPQFEHNYNQVAREMMYDWFAKYLKLPSGTSVIEKEFEPVPIAELSVFDSSHPRPADTLKSEQLREVWTAQSKAAVAATLMGDKGSVDEFRKLAAPAARVMFGSLPEPSQVTEVMPLNETDTDSHRLIKVSLTRTGEGQEIPVLGLFPSNFNGSVVLWVDGRGTSHLFGSNGQPTSAVSKLLASGQGVVAADLYMTGSYLPSPEFTYVPKVDSGFASYTYCYNRPVISERVRDLLTVIAAVRKHPRVTSLHLAGTGDAGLWALLARAQAGAAINRTVIDLNGASFSKVNSLTDPNLLPGGLKYGGIGGFAALVAPAALTLAGTQGSEAELTLATRAYELAKGTLTVLPGKLSDQELVNRLTQP